MADYKGMTNQELLELARERDIKGRSSMNHDELAKALEKSDREGGSDSRADQIDAAHEGGRGLAQTEGVDAATREKNQEQRKDREGLTDPKYGQDAEDLEGKPGVLAPEEEATADHHRPESDPKNPAVQEALSPEGKEALEEYGEDSEALQESDLALDAVGPLHLEKPSERVMTGAVNEDHAKEQEKELKKLPKEYHGQVPEVITDEHLEKIKASVGKAKSGPVSTDPADYIEFAPPIGVLEEQRKEALEKANDRRAKEADGSGSE